MAETFPVVPLPTCPTLPRPALLVLGGTKSHAPVHPCSSTQLGALLEQDNY